MRNVLLGALAALSLSGCAAPLMNTSDSRRAVVLAPYSRPVGLNRITVREGEVLYASLVGNDAAWCSAGPAYFALGEARAVCFFDPAGGNEAEGWLKTAYVAGTLGGIRMDVDVPYRVTAGPALPPRR